MKKILLTTIIASGILYANGISIDSMGLNIGNSSIDYTKKDHSGTIILGNEPNESFNSFEVYTTLKPISDICKKYNMKPYFSYTYSKNDGLKHQYLLTGINKYHTHKLSNKELTLYSGLIVGYGQIDWKYDPLNSSKNKNISTNSFVGAIQVGVDYPIKDKFSLGLNAKYLLSNYETNLKPSAGVNSTIEHNDNFNISLGISYKF